MTLQGWLLYLNAVFLLSAIPGPNMTHIMTFSTRHGLRRCTHSMAGCLLALIVLLTASAAGLSAVLTASPMLFRILKYAGAFYLIQLGLRAWLDRSADRPDIDGPAAVSVRASLATSFLVGISNPKAIIFAASFLPQFVDPSASQPPQYAVLIATSAATETLWMLIYATGGARLSAVLTRPAWRRRMQRVSGSLFVLFGGILLLHDQR
ncbi:LysE family translocator [Gluconacetobacter azotocaptans]|uniref:LysE family translocator n=1 Tax=Gluconacetobacter azotocaptans TaxID=142834 RepID=A0A7W4PCI2_9PROT|nr:LysE family translocator [Gluconacetobacter azotocaptans]MBB2188670.1 LysE family translocator [Gluconacetobacter azotocaptans]MBM9400433.1 LysE family translocator [Gluconacetobacter azotocaptans]GBQ35154.1 lysine/threonine exporter protein LysE [Gluconacetobacter azotocaptans DSM 13594]